MRCLVDSMTSCGIQHSVGLAKGGFVHNLAALQRSTCCRQSNVPLPLTKLSFAANSRFSHSPLGGVQTAEVVAFTLQATVGRQGQGHPSRTQNDEWDVNLKHLRVALDSLSRCPAGSANQALHTRGRGCPSFKKGMLVRNTAVAPSTPKHNSCQQLAAH